MQCLFSKALDSLPNAELAFRALLREEVSSGRLDKAPSKADVLAELCNRLNFDPDAASALHKQLYRQKLDSLLEKKSLTGTAQSIGNCMLLLEIGAKEGQAFRKGQSLSMRVEDTLGQGKAYCCL